MSASPNLHGMSDAAARSFDRLVACPFVGCNGGDVDGEPCERCGGEGRVAPPPALPAMPQPARVAASAVRREYDGARALYTAAARLDTSFEVWREIDGERMTVLVSSNELTPGEVAALTPELRAAYDADEARWAEVWEQMDALAEAEGVASKRDGETALHNGEPAPELVRECEAAAAAE